MIKDLKRLRRAYKLAYNDPEAEQRASDLIDRLHDEILCTRPVGLAECILHAALRAHRIDIDAPDAGKRVDELLSTLGDVVRAARLSRAERAVFADYV